MNAQVPLVGLSVAELTAALEATGLEAKPAACARANCGNWIYVHGQRDFAAMTNLAKDFCARVAEQMSLSRPEIVDRTDLRGRHAQMAAAHRARHRIRNRLHPEEDRGTLCVSSQVGCTLNCRFCHTGTQKLVRNLTPYEIVARSWSRATRSAIGPLPVKTGVSPMS